MQFASFNYPRQCFTLPRGTLAKRLAAFKSGPRICGPYYQEAPVPATAGAQSAFFYHESDFMPGLRWKYADEVIRLYHRGWFCDDYQDETIRGLVFRLPHGRGFLPAWTMGAKMASSIDYDRGSVCDTEEDGARMADGMAERAAEREREYQAAEEVKRREEEERAELLSTGERDQSGEH